MLVEYVLAGVQACAAGKDNTSAAMTSSGVSINIMQLLSVICLRGRTPCLHPRYDLAIRYMIWCRKHEWIVKGGEEVRIDQRIEQLFDVMNGLMHRQPGAAVHSLQVSTHVPFNSPTSS